MSCIMFSGIAFALGVVAAGLITFIVLNWR